MQIASCDGFLTPLPQVAGFSSSSSRLNAPSSPEYSGGSSGGSSGGEELGGPGGGEQLELRRVLEVSRVEADREEEQLQEALRRSMVEEDKDTGEVKEQTVIANPAEEASSDQVSWSFEQFK